MSESALVRPRVRLARLSDLPAVEAIYAHYVGHTAITLDEPPVTEAHRARWARLVGAPPAAPAGAPTHRMVVVDVDGAVAGFAYSDPVRAKAAFARSAELTVYLRTGAEGRGLGRRLVVDVLERLAAEGAHRAYAAVTLPNDASLALLAELGFQEAGVWRESGFKLGRYWDVGWFELDVPAWAAG